MVKEVTGNENEMEVNEKIIDISIEKKQPSEWTEVTGKTIEELKEKAKVNFDNLLGNTKTKSPGKR